MMNFKTHIKRLLFYWAASFATATVVYYVLWALLPDHRVFGALYRMFLYHWDYPLPFIAIPCFFYGIIATLSTETFRTKKTGGQILLIILLLILTVLISSPFGGMLWFYYDMRAGFFPENWISILINRGFDDGLEVGWLILLISVPYNIIVAATWYFLMRKGSKIY